MDQAEAFKGITFSAPSGHFVLNQQEVAFIEEKGDDTPVVIKVCAPLRVAAKTRDPKSGLWGRLLEWTDDDGLPHQFVMPQSMLEGDGLELRQTLASGGLHIEQSKKARELFAKYLKLYPVDKRVRCVDRLGWHSDMYVTASGTIGQSNETVLFQGTAGTDMTWDVMGNTAQWRESVAALAQGNSRLVFAIGVALSGPLLTLSGQPSGGFHFRGASSSGKSTALQIAASVWGNPKKVVGLWRSTLNGLESVAAMHNDGVVILDEIGQLDPVAAGESAYMLANGRGKARAGRHGQAMEPKSWNLIFLSAGEDSLSSLMAQANKKTSVGQEIRLADIEAYAGCNMGIVQDLHGVLDAKKFIDQVRMGCEEHHGALGQAWLESVVTNRAAIAGRLRGECAHLSEQWVPHGASGQVARVASRFALVAVAGELATQYGLTGWAQGESQNAAKQCFDAWLDGYGGTEDKEDRRILDQVEGFLDMHGASRFQNLKSNFEPHMPNRVGYYRDLSNIGREYLVPSNAFTHEICHGLDIKRAKQVLHAHAILQPGSKGFSQTVRLPHHGARKVYVLHFPAPQLPQ